MYKVNNQRSASARPALAAQGKTESTMPPASSGLAQRKAVMENSAQASQLHQLRAMLSASPSSLSRHQAQTQWQSKAPVAQRLINFGAGWDAHTKASDLPKEYQLALEQGNVAAVMELEVASLRKSSINQINELIDHTGTEAMVTIREGIHSDDTGGREAAHHQTVNVTVNRKTWKYHVLYAQGNNGWDFLGCEQQNEQKGDPSLEGVETNNLYPPEASSLKDANIFFDLGAIAAGKSFRVGPLVYTATGTTQGRYSEILIIHCPRYIGQVGEKRWIAT
jgi:hypothetical protein